MLESFSVLFYVWPLPVVLGEGGLWLSPRVQDSGPLGCTRFSVGLSQGALSSSFGHFLSFLFKGQPFSLECMSRHALNGDGRLK